MSLQKEPSKHTHDWPHTPLFIALLNYSKQLHNFACYTATTNDDDASKNAISSCANRFALCSRATTLKVWFSKAVSHHRLACGKWSYVCEKTISKASPNVPFWPFMTTQEHYSHQTISCEFTLKFRDPKTRRLSLLLPHVPHTHSKYRLIRYIQV